MKPKDIQGEGDHISYKPDAVKDGEATKRLDSKE